MKTNIVHIAKTDLNTDGRVLNELKILQEAYPKETISFILLPDQPYRLKINNLRVFEVKCIFRKNKTLRVFTVLEFTLKALILLFKISPKIIHIQDASAILPAYLYQFFKRKKAVLIYDDHEIPNNFNHRGFSAINLFLENRVLKTADTVIFANEERQEFLKEKLKLRNHLTYFLNLPYFEEDEQDIKLPPQVANHINTLDKNIENGGRFIMHQGVIKLERGEQKLAEFSKKLPSNFKIMLVGGTEQGFNDFLEIWDLDSSKFYFVGTVDYFYLSQFWNRCVGSIVMYLPDLLNNRLCAPNRFYLSLQKKLPVIVNRDNPVLSNFVEKYNCGFYIEYLDDTTIGQLIHYNHANVDFSYELIREEQINNFLNIYDRYN